MASVVYNEFKRASADNEIDLVADSVRAILVMASTTAGSQNDGIVFVSDLTTLDECDDSAYARVTLAGKSITKEDANDRAVFNASDVVYTPLTGDASRNAVGVVIYKHVGADTANPVVGYVEFTTPLSGTSTQVTVPFGTTGVLRLT